MAIGKVEICGVDTSTLPVISNERMRQLFPLVHGGDMQAREEFIRAICGLCSACSSGSIIAAKMWTICFRSAASD